MICPKCGRNVESGAFICPGCDFILDTSFLGDDITDDERDTRPAAPRKEPRANKADFGEDAMILGDVNDLAAAEVSSFKSRDAGVSQREVTQARFYFGGVVAQLMSPDAIPEIAPGVGGASIRMTPFERHVLSFINGKRSVGRIQRKSAMEESEYKTALAMLADKGFIRLRGFKKPRPRPGDASAALPSRGGDPGVTVERTVVASMEHIEALAKRPIPPADQPASREAQATRVVPTPGASSRSASRRSRREAVRVPRVATPPPAEAPDPPLQVDDTRPLVAPQLRSVGIPSLPEASMEDPPALDADRDPLAAAQAAMSEWDLGQNQSSVFAETAPKAIAPSLADADDEDGADDDGGAFAERPRPAALAEAMDEHGEGDFDAAGFDDVDDFEGVRTRALDPLEALRDPTGLGDDVVADEAVAGAPVDDEDPDRPVDEDEAYFDPDDDDDPEGSFDDGLADDRDDAEPDDGAISLPAHRIHSAVTGSIAAQRQDLPPDDDDEQHDDDDPDAAPPFAETPPYQEPDAPTGVMPSSRPMTLPSDALLPVEPAPRTAGTPAPTTGSSERSTSRSGIAPALALPGQALVTPQTARPIDAPVLPPRPATRVSATSQVSFELRKKAERIYEQAIKDHQEGRLSSAIMNAKLAMNFDPTVDTYRELFEALNESKQQGGNKPGAGAARPRELVLFEQASDAEGRGDYERAVSLLEEAVEINPKAAALRNRLGVVLSIRLKRHEEALVHLKKAIELEPGSIVYMNNYSKVTGLLESVIERGGDGKKKKGDKVAVKKIRPKLF